MTRREQIERILRTYLYRMERTAVNEAKPSLSANLMDKLIESLATCWPEPSREALEKILLEEFDYDWHTEMRQRLTERLMAWARGEPVQPKWCEHVTWYDKSSIFGIRGWNFYPDDSVWNGIGEKWTVCPICAAPRPDAA